MVLRPWLQLRNLNVGRELAPDLIFLGQGDSGASSSPTVNTLHEQSTYDFRPVHTSGC